MVCCNPDMNTRILVALGGLALVAGCASGPKTPASPQAPGTASPGVAPAPVPTVSLPAEQRRLADLFRGTPVVIEMQADGSMRVAVPLKFSFDKGRAAVKPPLAKVLDYVVPSLKGQNMRARVAAPCDTPKGSATLAQERASSTRDYLVAKGIPMTHFASLAPSPTDGVEIVIGDSALVR